jgi:hypothetical protein
MAFLAYYKILHLLGPVEGVASKEDAISYAKELTANVDKIMASLQGVIRVAKEPSGSKKTDRNKAEETDKKKSKADKAPAPVKEKPAAAP